jgi:hypothetical protein
MCCQLYHQQVRIYIIYACSSLTHSLTHSPTYLHTYLFTAGNEEAATLNVAVDKTWISQWLAAIDADFSSYSACFESQGITNRVDLEQSDLLTPNDLLNTLMVSKLGHRMKITHWHKLLLQEKSLPASMVL